MEGLALLALVLGLWILVGPVFGLIALGRARTAREEAESAVAEIRRLRQQVEDGSEPAAPNVTQQQTWPAEEAPKPSSPPQSPVEPTKPKPLPAESAAPTRAIKEPGFVPPVAPPPPASPYQKPAAERPDSERDWERLIAANWMIWAGGLALAVGGLFLVRAAIDAGYFGPLQRTIAAALFGVGLIAGAFKLGRSETVKSADTAVRFLPQVLAAAGVISLYGASIACGMIYSFVSAFAAFAMVAAVSVLAVFLSLRFGPPLAVMGLVGAYVAPLLTGAEGGSLLQLLPYFVAVTGGGLALVRLTGRRWLSWILLIGAGIWGLLAAGSQETLAAIAVPTYALILAVMGLVFGASEARTDLTLPKNGVDPQYIAAGFGSSQLAAYLFWLLAGGLIVLTGLVQEAGPAEAAALAVYGGLGILSAWQRPGYSLIAPIAGAATLVCLSLWAVTSPPLVYACLAAAIGFGAGGAIAMKGQRLKAPLAATSALVPAPALFIAFWRDGGLQPNIGWGIAALFIALFLTAVLEQLRRADPGFKRHPGAAAAYALGAMLSLGLAPFLVLDGFWLGTAMAAVSFAIAAVLQRFELPLLRLGAMGTAALATALLIRPGVVDPATLSTTLILNSMTAGFSMAIICFFAASRLVRNDIGLRRAFEGAAMILGFTLIGLTIRHIAGEGCLDGPFNGMGEASAYAIAYLGMAASFAWRFSDRGMLFRVAEFVAAGIGLFGVLAAFTMVGLGDVGDFVIVNLLFPGFALPALLMSAYGTGLRRAGRKTEATVASVAAMLTGFAWVTLEIARSFGGQDLTVFYGDFGWAYSPAWITYAFALLFWGVLRRRRAPRFASLAILITSILKVFMIDMSMLEGVARAGSLIGLGLALIAVALFYQRFVFTLDQQSKAEA